MKEAAKRREPLTLFLRVADLGWDILNFQSPFPFSFFSPAVDSHEFPVCEPLIGEIQQSAIGNAALESEGPVWGARHPPRGQGSALFLPPCGFQGFEFRWAGGQAPLPTDSSGCFQSLTAEAHSH